MPVPAGPGGPPPIPGDPIYYDPVLSRVRVTVDGLSDLAPVTVQRSLNEITWSTVRGGVVTPSGGRIRVDDYEFAAGLLNYYRVLGPDAEDLFTGTITPTIDRVWVKSLARPFLNRAVVIQDYGDVERPSRAGVFEVIGRTYPVAVNDVRGSRRWTLDLLTSTAAEAADVDMLLASGDTLLVQVPADCDVPGGYVSVGSTSVRRTARRTVRRITSLPCTEVAAPGPDVVGATITWQGLLNVYGTWAEVIAAHPTWADLLELIGDPTDVIVP